MDKSGFETMFRGCLMYRGRSIKR